jgi:soluble lytic murein transglycosylase
MALEYLRDIRCCLHTDYYRAWAAYLLGIYTDSSLLSEAVALRPGSYYSFRAAHKLKQNTQFVQNTPVNSMQPLESAAGSILYELCSLGYLGEIGEILQSGLSLAEEDSTAGYLFLFSKLAYAHGDPYLGIGYAEKLLSSLDSPPLLSLPSEVLELLYPKVFCDVIERILKDSETDMEAILVLSVVREESRYNRFARSSKGALGLMQLMPDTASWILRDAVSDAQLADPYVNISAGTAYLDYLFRRLETTEYVVAAYNGGPNNVKKWMKKNPHRSIEVFIEEIPYRETRNFVKRVYTSYYMYRFLYDENHSLVDCNVD